MDHAHRSKRVGSGTSDEEQIFCSSCAAEPALFISLLDTQSGKQHRVFKCECGKIVWDD